MRTACSVLSIFLVTITRSLKSERVDWSQFDIIIVNLLTLLNHRLNLYKAISFSSLWLEIFIVSLSLAPPNSPLTIALFLSFSKIQDLLIWISTTPKRLLVSWEMRNTVSEGRSWVEWNKNQILIKKKVKGQRLKPQIHLRLVQIEVEWMEQGLVVRVLIWTRHL